MKEMAALCHTIYRRHTMEPDVLKVKEYPMTLQEGRMRNVARMAGAVVPNQERVSDSGFPLPRVASTTPK